MNIIYRALRKPPKVIAFRAAQELRLGVMRYCQAWPRLEQSIKHWWSDERAQLYAATRKHQLSIITPDVPEALRTAAQRQGIDYGLLFEFGRCIRERKFELLGAQVPTQGEFPWHSDWHWGYTWEPAYFRGYDFYARDRQVPYDVKVPWELSRMGFVLPLLQNAAFEPEGGWIDAAITVIFDWERKNPLAYTVNWYPMEAAMRGINLVFALEMLLSLGESRTEVLALLLRLISLHGAFLWRTIEYTDIRGNHYAANLIALLLFGLVLRGLYPAAQCWLNYAVEAIPHEIELQFLPDGAHFEKSISYHRLVTELFLVGIMAMERAGWCVGTVTKERIHAACSYTAAYMRPDRLTPNVGDNDDSRVFGFDPVPVRDHRPLIGVGATFFRDPVLKATAGSMSAALVWLLGAQGVAAWDSLTTASAPGTQYFHGGGVVVTRQADNFLWVDVGEVGLAGRGGHGHNDILSFELVLRGHPLVVDPGSFVYTADPDARDLFRSTAYHNGLRLDGIEIAPMDGMWSIGDHATPCNVEVRTERTVTVIRAGHLGYKRLPDPVLHVREIRFDAKAGTFICADQLECAGQHQAERYLHLDPEVEVALQGNRALLTVDGKRWVVQQWETNTNARIDKGWVSPGYNVRRPASILVLANTIEKSTVLNFTIEPITQSIAFGVGQVSD
jgi:uncharacterized heparinase superfamily protein